MVEDIGEIKAASRSDLPICPTRFLKAASESKEMETLEINRTRYITPRTTLGNTRTRRNRIRLCREIKISCRESDARLERRCRGGAPIFCILACTST